MWTPNPQHGDGMMESLDLELEETDDAVRMVNLHQMETWKNIVIRSILIETGFPPVPGSRKSVVVA